MRRAAILLAALVPLALPAASLAGTAGPGDAPKLRAVVSSCQTGSDPAMRAASFTASMPALATTARMAIRFDLQQRTVDGGVWQRVAAPSFGRWERSRPGVAGFVYTKDVHGLTAPGEFRAAVRFRWFAQDGTVREVRRITRSCKQPDARPRIVTGAIQAGAPDPVTGAVAYRVPVRNAGKAPAGPVTVALELDGAEVARASVPGLAPGSAATVTIAAPAMPVERLTAVATLDGP